MFYKLVAGVDIFELNPGLLAVPGYKELTDMQLKYICLICDTCHDNPVRTLQGKTKREKAAILAGYKLESDGKRLQKNGREIVDGRNKTIEDGIALFKSLHYDEKTDTYEALVSQIGEIRDFLKSRKENNPQKLKQAMLLGAKLPELVEAKQKLERVLGLTTTMKPELDLTFTTADLIPPPVAEEESDSKPLEEITESLIDQYHKKRTPN